VQWCPHLPPQQRSHTVRHVQLVQKHSYAQSPLFSTERQCLQHGSREVSTARRRPPVLQLHCRCTVGDGSIGPPRGSYMPDSTLLVILKPYRTCVVALRQLTPRRSISWLRGSFQRHHPTWGPILTPPPAYNPTRGPVLPHLLLITPRGVRY